MRDRRAAGRSAAAWAAILGGALSILFGGARCARAQAAAEPKVQVCGVRVVGAGYETDDEVLRAFRWRKGTTVALLVTVPDGGLISVNRDETKVAKMTDDRGTDLTVSSKGITREAQVSRGTQVSADSRSCIIEINGQEVPATGATYIAVAGTLSLKCGGKKEAGRQAKVDLKPGTEFSAGGMSFTVLRASNVPRAFELPKSDEAAPNTLPVFEVALQTKQDWSDIASVTFLDADGKDLGAKPGAIAAATAGGKVLTAAKTFILPQQVDAATIVVTCWEEFKDIEVPFDIKATVGIP
ncbi:MAG: hypothetical protein ABSA67_18345 [Candidatus Brocadiia bacterium]|jgi:hypothetical protein